MAMSYVNVPAVSDGTFFILIRRDTIPQNLIMSHGVAPFTAGIAGIAFYGVDDPVFAFLHDTHMVGVAITVPVKEDQHTGCRLDACICPLAVDLNHWTPLAQLANFGMIPASI